MEVFDESETPGAGSIDRIHCRVLCKSETLDDRSADLTHTAGCEGGVIIEVFAESGTLDNGSTDVARTFDSEGSVTVEVFDKTETPDNRSESEALTQWLRFVRRCKRPSSLTRHLAFGFM